MTANDHEVVSFGSLAAQVQRPSKREVLFFDRYGLALEGICHRESVVCRSRVDDDDLDVEVGTLLLVNSFK